MFFQLYFDLSTEISRPRELSRFEQGLTSKESSVCFFCFSRRTCDASFQTELDCFVSQNLPASDNTWTARFGTRWNTTALSLIFCSLNSCISAARIGAWFIVNSVLLGKEFTYKGFIWTYLMCHDATRVEVWVKSWSKLVSHWNLVMSDVDKNASRFECTTKKAFFPNSESAFRFWQLGFFLESKVGAYCCFFRGFLELLSNQELCDEWMQHYKVIKTLVLPHRKTWNELGLRVIRILDVRFKNGRACWCFTAYFY